MTISCAVLATKETMTISCTVLDTMERMTISSTLFQKIGTTFLPRHNKMARLQGMLMLGLDV
jgi:hypothetical protein